MKTIGSLAGGRRAQLRPCGMRMRTARKNVWRKADTAQQAAWCGIPSFSFKNVVLTCPCLNIFRNGASMTPSMNCCGPRARPIAAAGMISHHQYPARLRARCLPETVFHPPRQIAFPQGRRSRPLHSQKSYNKSGSQSMPFPLYHIHTLSSIVFRTDFMASRNNTESCRSTVIILPRWAAHFNNFVRKK